MKKVIVLNKKEGKTPLEVINNFKKKNPKYLNLPITYAGRLDPMASGLLILLVGEKIKEKEKYLALDKVYDFSILFGFSTDTFDILGKVCEKNFNIKSVNISINDFKNQIQNNLKYFKGKIKQKYPIYSSKTINGKPLFNYARNNIKVKIPEKDIIVKKILFKKITKITGEKLFLNIKKRISKVKGDFRQNEILKLWQKNLSGKKNNFFYIVHFSIKCTSGTYIREIAKSFGVKIKIPSLAFSIKRTKLGKYKI